MRPTKDQWAMQLALVTARRATCLRRAVGCVLLNKRGHVIATGYNGVAAGQKHCNEPIPLWFASLEEARAYSNAHGNCKVSGGSDGFSTGIKFPHACPGTTSPSGTNLDACQAIHAEQNALLQCKDVYAIHTCYVTASPCVTCTKLLLNTGCQQIVFVEEYPQPAAKDLWTSSGRFWEQLVLPDTPH